MTLLRDSATYAVVKVVPAVATFFGVLLFIRLVGPTEYGRYALLWSVAATVSAFSVGWLNQAQLRFFGQFGKHSFAYGATVQQGLTQIARAVLGVSAVLIVGATLLGSGAGPLQVLLVVVASVSLMNFSTRAASLQAQLRPMSVLRLESVRAVLHLVAPLALMLLWARDATALVLGISCAYLVAASTVRPWTGSKETAPAFAATDLPSLPRLKDFWNYGWPLSFWLGITMAFQVSDRVIIQHFLGLDATGRYASLFDLVARSFSLALFPVTMAVHPRVMNAWNDGQAATAGRLVRAAMIGQAVIFVPVGIALYYLGEPLFSFLLPGVDVDRSVVISIAAGAFTWQMALLAHKRLELSRKTKTMLSAVLAVWMADVLVNLLFVRRYGLNVIPLSYLGAGLAYSAACIVLSSMSPAPE